MDELELLKKDWQANSSQVDQQISSKDIYPIMHKKSSSIVKTLFYISIAELLFWIGLNFYPYFASEEYREELTAMYGNSTTLLLLTILSSVIVVVFVFSLYKSYKKIAVTDSTKKLMENILKTRKIIKYYVIFNLGMAFVSMVIGVYYTMYHNSEISSQFTNLSDKQMFVSAVLMIVFIAIFLLVFWVFYGLIYGILLKRLNGNYKELKKLEV
ncbi:MAG: ABC-type Fe3+ transport system permease subunit [Glaciecola sp.]|jgi:ABC-type Fe3+ transport system permease subunit